MQTHQFLERGSSESAQMAQNIKKKGNYVKYIIISNITGECLFSTETAIMVCANLIQAYTGDFNPICGFSEMIFQCFMC